MIVWLCEIPSKIDKTLVSFLPLKQRERFSRYVRPIRAAQYLYSRLFYLKVLELLGIADRNCDFPINAHHKPIISSKGTFYTSLSHSGNYFSLALSMHPVAVDIEIRVDRCFDDLADFIVDEYAASLIKNSPDKNIAFYRYWCHKECQIKLQSFETKNYISVSHPITTLSGTELMLSCLHSPSEITRIKQINSIFTPLPDLFI